MRCQELRYRQHSSEDYLTTQAPPLRQRRIASGGGEDSTVCLQNIRIYVFRVDFGANIDCPYITLIYNRGGKCLLRGTD